MFHLAVNPVAAAVVVADPAITPTRKQMVPCLVQIRSRNLL